MSKLRQILKNNYFEINALISIIIFGIIFSIFLPFQMAPDEEVHMYGAYSVSDRMMGIEPFSVNGTTNMRNDDRLDGYLMNGYTHENLHIYWDKLKEGVSDETIVDSGHPAPNSLPYSYFFASLGITIGRLLHLGAMKVFFLGRIFNLIFFAVTIFFSIKIIPKGKSILFALSLMPMSVELAASLSYDAFLIPLMFLITALTVKIITDGTLNKKEFILLIAVSLLISPMKGGAYLPIIVIPYFYLLWKNRKKIIKDDKIRHIIYICIIGLIIIASLLVFLYFRMKPDENYHEVLDLQGYSIPYIAKHPLHASKVFFNTVITSSGWYFDTFCGMLLGRLEIAVNQILRLFYVIILFLASIKRDY